MILSDFPLTFSLSCCWNVISSGVEVQLQKPIPSGLQVVKWSQLPRSTTHTAWEKENHVLVGFSKSTSDLVKLPVLTVGYDCGVASVWKLDRVKFDTLAVGGKKWEEKWQRPSQKYGQLARKKSLWRKVRNMDIWMAFCQHVSPELREIWKFSARFRNRLNNNKFPSLSKAKKQIVDYRNSMETYEETVVASMFRE